MDTGTEDQSLNPRLYQPGPQSAWQGRIDGYEPEHRRWHQQVSMLDLNTTEGHPFPDSEGSARKPIILLGFACDEGVRRNQGRTGARQGPEALRKALANLPIHQPELHILDAGDIVCPDEELEVAQSQLGRAVRRILETGAMPLLLGGGHEVTYGHYLGLKTSGELPQRRLGIINFDAHFDNREPGESGPNSGTGFWQIAQDQQQLQEEFHYLAIGIQETGNTRALFQRAEESGTKIVLASDFHPGKAAELTHIIGEFLNNIDDLYLTIDLDVFAAAYAPGVSAPTALGLVPDPYLFNILDIILHSGKLRSADFAELNPSLDQDQRTAKLAAALIEYISTSLSSLRSSHLF